MGNSLRKTIGACLFGAGVLITLCSLPGRSVHPSVGRAAEASAASSDARRHSETIEIQNVRVGMRLPAANPDLEYRAPDLGAEVFRGWQEVELILDDGEKQVQATLLRPESWLEEAKSGPSDRVWLNIPEMNAAGFATIISVKPAGHVGETSSDPTRTAVVTGTFCHTAETAVTLTVDDNVGTISEQLTCTDQHPFWSDTRNEFVAANSLEIGEQLVTATGQRVTLTSIVPRAGPTKVYGLEVWGEHVYHVGHLGLLVHNSSVRSRTSNDAFLAGYDRIFGGAPKKIEIQRSKHPETARHIEDAQAAGHPKELTLDRPNAGPNRSQSLKGHDKVPGKQLDEYPLAFTKEGGQGASVRPIDPSDNMGAGARIGNLARDVPDGGKIIIEVVD